MTHPDPRPAARAGVRLVVVGAIVALAALSGAGGARADGDPASDVLVTQNLFVPLDMQITRQTEMLTGLLDAAAQAGFKIRVALIASAPDLGTVTALWDNPKAYSEYLGIELSQSFTGQVAVVMPDGIYVYRGGVKPTAAEVRVADALPAPGSGPRLVTAAITAVERLAAALGHPLNPAAVRVAAPAPAEQGAGGQLAEWLALAIGVALIAAAWAASLRALPLQLHRGRRSA